MKKTIKLQDLGCASCAAKIEHAVSKLDGVIDIKINFLWQRMILETADDQFERILAETKRIAKKIEPDLTILA